MFLPDYFTTDDTEFTDQKTRSHATKQIPIPKSLGRHLHSHHCVVILVVESDSQIYPVCCRSISLANRSSTRILSMANSG